MCGRDAGGDRSIEHAEKGGNHMKKGHALCDECGRGHFVTVMAPRRVPFRGIEYAVADAEYEQCDVCGYVYFTRAQLVELQRKAAAEARRGQGLLTPDEIKRLRTKLGLKQTDLETILDVSPKTVTRWERGTVFQNRTADKFMRLLVACPEILDVIRRGGTGSELEDSRCSKDLAS
jgi:HTH-type transcriptional regulator/antitoxin MqsA